MSIPIHETLIVHNSHAIQNFMNCMKIGVYIWELEHGQTDRHTNRQTECISTLTFLETAKVGNKNQHLSQLHSKTST